MLTHQSTHQGVAIAKRVIPPARTLEN